MRYDAEHKARTRSRVLQEAIRAIRTEGPDRIGVAGVMKRAGLTHGGFYAHFQSKDDLVLAAIEQMFADVQGAFQHYTAGKPPREALRAYIGFYLSRTHRDSRDSGCPLPVLASDLPRLAAPTRARFAEGVTRLTASLARLLGELGRSDPQALASSVLAELIGALSLARAVDDEAQSDALLSRSRAALYARLGLEDAR